MTTSSAESGNAGPTGARSRTRAVVTVLALVLAAALPGYVVAPPALAAVAEVGYRDFSYGTGTTAPTADKPQSKLWFNAGQWWGSLYSPATKAFTVHRLDGMTQEWSDTGVVVDSRSNAKVDALWEGGKLYVAAGGASSTAAADSIRVTRYSFVGGAYVRDEGFPVTVVTGGSESVVLDRDSTGALWLTYTRGGKVYVTHSTAGQAAWVAPYVLPVEGANDVAADDVSALVSFGGQIGVLWGNQNPHSKSGNSYWFAVHRDGTDDSAASWSRELAYGGVPGTENADDHMNVKSLQTDSAGRIFASVKTSLNAADDPLVVLLVREPTGVWDRDNVFGKAAENHTRAIVLLDDTNQTAHVFAASPCCSGGVIYHKKVSFAALRNGNPFANGLGAPFIRSSRDTTINNPTSTKQTLDGTTGLVVLASDDTSRWYLHNKMELAAPGTVVPDTSITSGPSGNVGSTSASFTFTSENTAATFECRLDSAAFAGCSSPQDHSGLAAGPHQFEVRAVTAAGADPSPAARSWTIDENLPAVFRPAADAAVKGGSPSTNFGTTPSLLADTSPQEESYLRFSIGGVGTRKVTGAKLRLYLTNGSTNGPALYRTQDAAWSETGITWSTKPSRGTTALGNKASVAANAWTEYDLTGTVNGDGAYGFALVADSSDGTDAHSREAVNRPEIVLTFAADNTAPQTTMTSAPSGTVATGTADLAFDSDEPGRFECRLDNAPFGSCTSPVHYTGLSDGDHVFAVRAVDIAGNVDASPATASWTVARLDPTAPETTITSAPSGTVDSGETVIEFLSDEPGTFQCRLDGSAYDECESPVHYLDLPDGGHLFEVVAVDAAGNVDETPATATWTVARPDTAAPQTTITAAPSGTVNSAEAVVEFVSDEPGTFQCRLDSSAFTDCTSPVRHVGLSDGEHSVEVRAVDAAGNVDATPATATWTVAADTLLADGFEEGLAAWSVRTGGDGTVGVQGDVVESGVAAARLSASSTAGSLSALRRTFTQGQQRLTVAADVRVAKEGASGANVPLLRLFDDSGARVLSLYRQNVAGNKVYVSYGGSAPLTKALLPLSTWARVEVSVSLAGAGSSEVVVRVDGVVVHSSTAATVASAIRTVQLGNETARQAFELYADDVLVARPLA